MMLKRLAFSLTILGAALTVLLSGAPASAQATRTWVSGVGDDVNPCSRTAPCKTFAGAISKTAAGGEINCLDPGGFGGVTITKAISIICGESGEAGVLVSGTQRASPSMPGRPTKSCFAGSTSGPRNGYQRHKLHRRAVLFIDKCNIQAFATNGVNVGQQYGECARRHHQVHDDRLQRYAGHR